MSTFKKILCPIDFSESSFRALHEAIWWLEAHERESVSAEHALLCLMHVLPNTYLTATDMAHWERDFEERDQALYQLHDIVKTQVPHHLHRCTLRVVQRGDPAQEITNAAEAEGYDLIVMGTHGLTGWRRLVMGSVTESVVRSAPCPVVTVRCGPGAENVRQKEVERVMCPTDFSDPSYVAVSRAGELATAFGADLQLLHVMPPLAPAMGIVAVEEFEQERGSEAAQALLGVIDKYVPQEMRDSASINRLVRCGNPAEQIVLAARQESSNLIVIATHGETGWRRLVLGSVAEEVVRMATCPVMTICARETASVPPYRPAQAEVLA